MPRGNYFSFSLQGIETVIRNIEQIEKEQDRKIAETIDKLADDVIADARGLAPIDEGALEAAINKSDVKKTIHRMYIDVGVSPEVEHYAVKMHEDFYTPGVKTESKDDVKGYTPGRKYLENAIKLNEENIIEKLQKALDLGD